MSAIRLQASLLKLLIVVVVYAASFALFLWDSTLLQGALAIGTVTSFVAFDFLVLRLRESDGSRKDTPILCAYYSTAFAFSTLACLLGFLLDPYSRSGVPSDGVVANAISPLLRVFVLTFIYIAVFSILSSIGFILALCYSRRSRRIARWLVAINALGFAILVFYALACILA